MTMMIAEFGPMILAVSAACAVLAGVVKGAVGFAMPMVMISTLSSLMAPELALAALIGPTLATNGVQALRQGGRAAWGSIKRFRVFLAVGCVTLAASAQLVTLVPQNVLLLLIGGPVVLFAAVQIAGWRPRFAPSARAEALVGGFAGAVGGVSGVWGPPTVLYLTAIETPKADQMRIQGVIYGLGAAVLTLAHVQSGVLRAETWGLSVGMIPPALLGMWLGLKVSDRIDQGTFRKATLVVLAVAGANLIRRGVMG